MKNPAHNLFSQVKFAVGRVTTTKGIRAVSLAWLLLYACALVSEGAAAENLNQLGVGPLYQGGPDEVAVLVEAPRDLTRANPSSFRLLLDDKDVAAAYDKKAFSQSGKELAWMLCIDVSGRVSSPLLQETKGALKQFLSSSRSLRAALMTTGANIQKVKDFQGGEQRETLTRAIDDLKSEAPASSARLDQVLSSALDDYEKAASGLPERRRILVVWGGRDESSRASLDNVIGRANALGIRIDVVALGKIKPRHHREDREAREYRNYRDSLLHDAANRTGGRYSFANPGEVSPKDALSLIYKKVTETEAVLAYFKYPPGALQGKKIGVELQQPHGPSMKGYMTANLVPPPQKKEEIPKGQEKGVPATPLPETIPEPVEPVRPEWVNWLIWIIVFVLAGMVLVAIVVIGRRQKPQKTIAMPEKGKKTPPIESRPIMTVPEPAPAQRVTETFPEPRRHTSVGGYFPPPGPQHPAALLIGVSGAVQGRRFPLEKEIFRIGADPANDLPIPGDEYVSGNHAYLRYEKGSLFIVDQNSLNGTFVNEQRVSGTARVLVPGDRIKIGNSAFDVSREG